MSTRWDQSLSTVHKLSSREKISAELGFEPWAAGWEARMPPQRWIPLVFYISLCNSAKATYFLFEFLHQCGYLYETNYNSWFSWKMEITGILGDGGALERKQWGENVCQGVNLPKDNSSWLSFKNYLLDGWWIRVSGSDKLLVHHLFRPDLLATQ